MDARRILRTKCPAPGAATGTAAAAGTAAGTAATVSGTETDTAAAAVTFALLPRTSFLITCASMFDIDFRREAERGR